MSINIDSLLKDVINNKVEELGFDPLFLPRGVMDKNKPNIEEIYNPARGTKASSKYDNFYDWDDAKVLAYLEKNAYTDARKLEDGSWVAIHRLLFAWSICTDISPMSPYAYRWCFQDKEEADYFLANIKEFDEVPKRKESLKGHRFHDGQARYVKYDKHGFKMW